MNNVFMYVSKEEYENACSNLKSGQTIHLYKNKNIEIDLKIIGRKIYKFISCYGEEDINVCLEDMYLSKSKVSM